MNLSKTTIKDRYRIIEKIGEGGSSIVYNAIDKKMDCQVAVKLMKKSVTSTYLEDHIRFRREIEIISKLNHPHIIKIFGEAEMDAQPLIIMELLTGNSLASQFEQKIEYKISNTVEIIRQLSESLLYVHNNGIIHRDLKPGNIFFVNDPEKINIKLLDFGIGWIIELGGISGEKEIAGTFGYMSPEATGILDKRVDERSDLYSLGVIFYRLLTGEAPFKGTDLNQILHHQVALNPIQPKNIKIEIPTVLNDMVMKLINKDPDLRYQSAHGLIKDLEKFEKGERDFEIGSNDQKIKLTYKSRLIGRDAQIKKIEVLFDKANHKKGGLCLIAGEAGIGKSRLVEEIRRYVYENNGLFLKGRCLNYENKFPYQPFKDAIDEYINKVLSSNNENLVNNEIERLKVILGDLSEIVIKLNPRLEKYLGTIKKLIPLEPERENQRFLMVLTDFFCNLVNPNKGCLLFLDDLQWVDESSLNLFVEILGKINKSNLLIVGTYRDNEINEDHKLEIIKNLAGESRCNFEFIKLEAFDQPKVNELIENILGERGNFELSNYILKKSNGNPFFVINIIRELVETKVIQWEEGSWKKEIQNLNEIPISNSLIDLF